MQKRAPLKRSALLFLFLESLLAAHADGRVFALAVPLFRHLVLSLGSLDRGVGVDAAFFAAAVAALAAKARYPLTSPAVSDKEVARVLAHVDKVVGCIAQLTAR